MSIFRRFPVQNSNMETLDGSLSQLLVHPCPFSLLLSVVKVIFLFRISILNANQGCSEYYKVIRSLSSGSGAE